MATCAKFAHPEFSPFLKFGSHRFSLLLEITTLRNVAKLLAELCTSFRVYSITDG